MPFYVPVGPRGHLFRLGCLIIGVMGGITYWWASRRRELAPLTLPMTLEMPEA